MNDSSVALHSDSVGSPLTICLFGAFEVHVDGKPLTRLDRSKSQWLLSLLVLRHDHEVERVWLAGTLWPESEEQNARNNLRTSLVELRRALGPESHRLPIERRRTLRLDLTGARVDVVDFDEALKRGDRESLSRAVALYRGPLLEEWAEDWVDEARRVRKEAYLNALEDLAAHALDGGKPSSAEQYLRSAVERDPDRETARRGLMRALSAQGSYAGAEEVYEDLRRLLKKELDAEPEPETTALFEQIRRTEEAQRKLTPHPRPSPSREDDRGPDAPRRVLPTGTITFFFTDIEGSTQLWERDRDAMGAAIARHNALVREAIEARGGVVFKMVGDAFCAAFATPSEAAAAALEAQQALRTERWGRTGALRVRMAVHTGTAEVVGGDDYQGPDLNRIARLSKAGHGGQILLSSTTRQLVAEHLPAGAGLRDLGSHRLKDLQHSEHLFQLLHPNLQADFPPLSSPDIPPGNLHRQRPLTSFIGRDQEMEEVKRQRAGGRLLTLVGPGGCGKTRLVLEVAADLQTNYQDGVWFVDLAPLGEPALVPREVASVLGLEAAPHQRLTETLADFLRTKRILLVLDNCEHVVASCATLAEDLLRACPNLRLLATSREALRIDGETTYRVPSLSLPDLNSLPSIECLPQQSEAVRLFVERARLNDRDFTLTSDNARAVAQVCHRLDGIPLAIELAAAWVRVMSAEEICARLEDCFRLLAGSHRGGVPRHRTMRAATDWSYDLISDAERVLLRRLSVFVGGCSLEAAEAVCAGDEVAPEAVLELLAQLVEKSLVDVVRGRETRYRLLETIRQYAAEKLQRSGEGAFPDTTGPSPEERSLYERHCDWYLALAEQAEPAGRPQGEWLDRMEKEHDNLWAALDRSIAAAGPRNVDRALRLGGALYGFWARRGYLTEGRDRLTRLLALSGASERTTARAKVLHGAGILAYWQGDYRAARALFEESLAIREEMGDRSGIAESVNRLGSIARVQGDYPEARLLHERSLAIWQELGDRQGIAHSSHELGQVAADQGDYRAARALFEESLAIRKGLDDRQGIADSLYYLGIVAMHQGNFAEARALSEESLSIRRDLDIKRGIATSLNSLGNLANAQGDYATARTHYEESLTLHRELGDRQNTATLLTNLADVSMNEGDDAHAARLYDESLALLWEQRNKPEIAILIEGLATVATRQGRPERAARLFGAAAALVEALGVTIPPADRAEYERRVAAARDAQGEAAFSVAWAEGQAMTLEEMVAYASETARLT